MARTNETHIHARMPGSQPHKTKAVPKGQKPPDNADYGPIRTTTTFASETPGWVAIIHECQTRYMAASTARELAAAILSAADAAEAIADTTTTCAVLVDGVEVARYTGKTITVNRL